MDVPVNVCGNTVNVSAVCSTRRSETTARTGRRQSRPAHAGPQHRTRRRLRRQRAGRQRAAGADTPAGRRNTHRRPAGTASRGTGRHRAGGAGAEAGTRRARPASSPATRSRRRSSVPVNVCGNSVTVVGLLNPASGNSCANDAGAAAAARHRRCSPRARRTTPVEPAGRAPATQPPEPNAPGPSSSRTSSSRTPARAALELLIPASAGLLLAGRARCSTAAPAAPPERAGRHGAQTRTNTERAPHHAGPAPCSRCASHQVARS